MSAVLVDNVTKIYPNNPEPAVNSLSFAVKQGEILTLLGPSGCGKTTILRLIAGFERPDEGEVRIAGKLVASQTYWVNPERRGVGMVFQDYALFPHLNIANNVAFGIGQLDKDKKKGRVSRILDTVGLGKFSHRYPHELSGGQQQRVALARALASKPRVILLDEPLSNLDADLRRHMRIELKQILDSTGITAVLVTHDQEDCFALATKIAVLRQGNIEQIGTAQTLYHEPKSRFVANFLGNTDFLPGYTEGSQIVTPLGNFPTSKKLPNNTKVDILIRPDYVSFAKKAKNRAVIVERRFRGGEVAYTLDVNGIRFQSFANSRNILAVGTKVSIKITIEHLIMFPQNRQERLR